jgi:hypothetical protein
MRVREISPRSTAATTASIARVGSVGLRRTSAPAFTASTVLCSVVYPLPTPSMVSASVMATPRKCSVSRKSVVMMRGDNVAGVALSPATAGSAMCAVITRPVPA